MLSFKCFVAPKKKKWYFSGAIVHGSARRKTRFPFVCAFALRNRGAYLIDAPSRESCSTRGLPLASTGSAEHSVQRGFQQGSEGQRFGIRRQEKGKKGAPNDWWKQVKI